MITYGDLKGIDFGLPWPGYDKKDYSGVDAGSIAADYSVACKLKDGLWWTQYNSDGHWHPGGSSLASTLNIIRMSSAVETGLQNRSA